MSPTPPSRSAEPDPPPPESPATEPADGDSRGPPERCPVCLAPDPRSRGSDRALSLFRCPACRSAFVHPVPSPETLRRRYEREHGEGKWGEIFRSAPAGEAAWRLDLLEELLGGPGRILDVGCGDGEFLDAGRERGWDGAGLEISIEAARACRERTPPVSVAVGRPSCVGARGRGVCDAVTFWDVLEHVPDPLDLLREGAAALKPGGLAAATMPNVHGTTAWLHGPRWTYYDVGLYGHLFHFSLRGLETLFRRAGLNVVHGRTRGSTDLREVPAVRWDRPAGPRTAALLDRVSGLLARVTVPLGYGNTLVVVGRKG